MKSYINDDVVKDGFDDYLKQFIDHLRKHLEKHEENEPPPQSYESIVKELNDAA